MANTTLISRPGSSLHTFMTSAPKMPPSSKAGIPSQLASRPSTCGPRIRAMKPPMIDTGRNSLCAILLRTRTSFPAKATIPRRRSARPIVEGDMRVLRSGGFAFQANSDLGSVERSSLVLTAVVGCELDHSVAIFVQRQDIVQLRMPPGFCAASSFNRDPIEFGGWP